MRRYFVVRTELISKGFFTHEDAKVRGLTLDCQSIGDGEMLAMLTGGAAEIDAWASSRELRAIQREDAISLSMVAMRDGLLRRRASLSAEIDEIDGRLVRLEEHLNATL